MCPMTPLTLEQLRVLVPSYVLGLLDADERAAFDGGMQDPAVRATLERDIATHRATIELMATAPPVAPLPEREASMMDGIIDEPRETVTDNVRDLAMARRAEVAAATPKRAKAVRQSPTSRATTSAAPPALKGTIRRMFFDG